MSELLRLDRPEAVGFDAARFQRACDLLHKWADTDKVPAAALCVGRRGRMVAPRLFGRQRPGADDKLRDDALFLIASLTKPITVAAVMLLVERGELTLEDRVTVFVPKFRGHGKEAIQVRQLMTHTSGLPDMVEGNEKLRAGHKPFSAFVEAICAERLLFPPGTRVSYQSTGIAMLAEIVHQVSGRALPEFLRREFFEPLGLADTSLGWQPAKKERIAAVRVPEATADKDWNWNSPYWLGFGAPWGGLVTSPADYAHLCQLMLDGGKVGNVRILGPATVRVMTINQLESMPLIPEEERRCRPWGLGWALNWPGHSANFGDLLGPRAFGHWGSTGTVCWIDPDTDAFCLLFTTQPQEPEGRFLARACNAVAAALV
jgi:CubicO group peptidase (beta-lactamase class C family)